MLTWRDSGLPVQSSALVWKKDSSATAEGILSAFEAELDRVDADYERIEDGLQATIPWLSEAQFKIRPFRQWQDRFPFGSITQIELHVRETERAFHVVARGRTSILLPVFGWFFGYLLVTKPPHLPGLVASILGVAWTLFYWTAAWGVLNTDVGGILRKYNAAQERPS